MSHRGLNYNYTICIHQITINYHQIKQVKLNEAEQTHMRPMNVQLRLPNRVSLKTFYFTSLKWDMLSQKQMPIMVGFILLFMSCSMSSGSILNYAIVKILKP